MPLPKEILVLVETQWDLTLAAVYFDLTLDFPTNEVAILVVEILCVYLEHGEIFTNIYTTHGESRRRVRQA